jgi:N-carbamoylputrescine amidase
VAVNRTGFEPTDSGDEGAEDAGRGLQFWGSSFVAAPDGSILAQAGESEETVLVVDLELDSIDRQRAGWPFLRDRRTDAYGRMTERYGDDEG